MLRLAAVWVVVAVAWPGVARAAVGGVSIRWTAPPECPSSSDVSASVGDLLGRTPSVPDGQRLAVDARAQRKQSGLWIGSVETRYGSAVGSRAFESESCRAVAEATALIVALMIDPDAVAAHARPPTAPPPKAIAAAPAAATATVTVAPPPAAPGLPLTFALGATAGIDVGTLPAITAGAGARLRVALGQTSVELGAAAWAPVSATLPGTAPAAGGRFRFTSASFAVCPTALLGRVALGACAEAEGVRVDGTGFGVSVPYENTSSWLSLGAGALARLRVTRHINVPLRLDALAPLARPTFTLRWSPEEQRPVYTPARVATRAELGVEVDF